MLILVLECGYNVFLFMQKGQNGKLEFVTVPAQFPNPREQLVYPGFHLAVDPSSRYMALACAQDFFVVSELQSHEMLNERYRAGESLQPVTKFHARAVQGVIHKVHFLYPRPEDVHHIVLLLIIVRNGRSRMVTYEWALGDDLAAVFAEDKVGHRMPPSNQMPVLIIPLTVKSSFMAISPDQIAVCTDILHSAPNFETFEMDDTPPTPNHYGLEDPIWTAWSRPIRLGGFFHTRDCVYLAREDGVVIFVEADREGAMDRTTFIHRFDSNISGAFACMFDMHADILLLGSDSGPGAIWKVWKSLCCRQLKLTKSTRFQQERPQHVLGHCQTGHRLWTLSPRMIVRPVIPKPVRASPDWSLRTTIGLKSQTGLLGRLVMGLKDPSRNTDTDSRRASALILILGTPWTSRRRGSFPQYTAPAPKGITYCSPLAVVLCSCFSPRTSLKQSPFRKALLTTYRHLPWP